MMWSWKDEITRKELLEHMYLLPVIPIAELKRELKKRDLPLSGRQEDMWLRLFFYDVANMGRNEIIPDEIWKKFYEDSMRPTRIRSYDDVTFADRRRTILFEELKQALEALETQRFALNWTSFPEVLLNE